jgi:hypothetical protein
MEQLHKNLEFVDISLGALTTSYFFLEQSAWSWNRLAKETWSKDEKRGAEQSQTPFNFKVFIFVWKPLKSNMHMMVITKICCWIMRRKKTRNKFVLTDDLCLELISYAFQLAVRIRYCCKKGMEVGWRDTLVWRRRRTSLILTVCMCLYLFLMRHRRIFYGHCFRDA